MTINNLAIKISFIILFISIISVNTSAVAQDSVDWKLTKNYDNIKVYVRKVPELRIKEVRAETNIKATLSEIIALIKDCDNHKNWVFLTEKATVVDSVNNCNWEYYCFINTPWPVSNRDYYTDVILNQNPDNNIVTITSTANPTFDSEVTDCVRINFIHSIWKLTPISNDSVNIILEVKVDPGGSIPAWLINLSVSKGPYNTMSGMLKQLDSDKYKNIKLDYITEPVDANNKIQIRH